MTRGLTDLPDELLLLILEVGSINIVDGVALRQTCKRLYGLYPGSYFLSVAKNFTQYLPLPLPPFQSLSDLPAEEAQRVCSKHYKSIVNLQSPEPKCKLSKVLKLTGVEANDNIVYFPVVQTGQLAFLIFKSGLMQVWDLRHQYPGDGSERSLCNLVTKQEVTTIEVGRLVSSYKLPRTPWEYDYEVLINGDVIFGIVVNPEPDVTGAPYPLIVLRYGQEKSTFVEINLADLQVSKPITLSVRGGAVVVLCEVNATVALAFVNYTEGTKWIILTGLPWNLGYEVIQSENGDLVLCASSNRAMELHVFWTVTRTLQDKDPVTSLPPDVSMQLEYETGSMYENTNWDTFRRRNPYTYPPLVMYAASRWQNPSSGQLLKMISLEFLDIEQILKEVRLSGPGTYFQPRKRNAVKFHSHSVLSPDDKPLRVESNQGFHSCWVALTDDDTEFRLQFTLLRDPDRYPNMGTLLDGLTKTLDLGINLDGVWRLLSFCDEAATLFLITGPCDTGGRDFLVRCDYRVTAAVRYQFVLIPKPLPMPASFLDLPDEIILLVIDATVLGISDALALRSTCRRLHNISRMPSYFMHVARNMAKYRPPPLPPFRSLENLGTDDLRKLCITYHKTNLNLASPEPWHRDCSFLPLHPSGLSSPVLFFSMFHGGLHGLIFYHSGLVQLWDLQFRHEDEDNHTNEGCSVVSDQSYVPRRVGKLLSTYSLGLHPSEYDYEAKGDGEVIIAAFSAPRMSGQMPMIVLSIISFKIPIAEDDAEVEVRELYKTEFHRNPTRFSVSIRDPIVVVVFEIGGEETMDIINYRRGQERKFNTSIEYKREHIYEIFISRDNHILLVAVSGNKMQLHAYFDVLQLFSSPFEPERVIPSTSFIAEYDTDSAYSDDRPWDTFHQRNAYTASRIAVISTSEWHENDPTHRRHLLAIEWLDVEDILRQAKATGSSTTLPPRRRNIHKFIRNPVISWDNFTLWRTTSRAYYSCWLDDDPAIGELCLRLVSLQRPDCDPELGWDVSKPSQYLHLPVFCSSIYRLLAFCDDTATLVVLTNACSVGCCPRAIRFFQY